MLWHDAQQFVYEIRCTKPVFRKWILNFQCAYFLEKRSFISYPCQLGNVNTQKVDTFSMKLQREPRALHINMLFKQKNMVIINVVQGQIIWKFTSLKIGILYIYVHIILLSWFFSLLLGVRGKYVRIYNIQLNLRIL